MFGAAAFGWLYPAGMIAADIGSPVGPTIPVEQPGGGGGWGFESTRRKKPRNAFHFTQDLTWAPPAPHLEFSIETGSEAGSQHDLAIRLPHVGLSGVVSVGHPVRSMVGDLAQSFPQVGVPVVSATTAHTEQTSVFARRWTEEDEIAADDDMVLALAASSGFMD